jgi:hypothetical protein
VHNSGESQSAQASGGFLFATRTSDGQKTGDKKATLESSAKIKAKLNSQELDIQTVHSKPPLESY